MTTHHSPRGIARILSREQTRARAATAETQRTSDINAEIKNVLTVNHGCSLAAKRFAISEIY